MTIREQIEAAMASELITVEQLALLSQYDPQTIYRKAQKGEIKGMVKFGRGIRFVRVVALGFVRESQERRDLRPTI